MLRLPDALIDHYQGVEKFEYESDAFLRISIANHRETVCHSSDRAGVKSYTFYRPSNKNNEAAIAVPGKNPRLHQGKFEVL